MGWGRPFDGNSESFWSLLHDIKGYLHYKVLSMTILMKNEGYKVDFLSVEIGHKTVTYWKMSPGKSFVLLNILLILRRFENYTFSSFQIQRTFLQKPFYETFLKEISFIWSILVIVQVATHCFLLVQALIPTFPLTIT